MLARRIEAIGRQRRTPAGPRFLRCAEALCGDRVLAKCNTHCKPFVI